MSDAQKPPTIAPTAASRWQRAAPASPPWLHEEVGRRMAERLEWIRLRPAAWADWDPVRGGLEAHDLVLRRYPKAVARVVAEPPRLDVARRQLLPPWWRVGAARPNFDPMPDGAVQMLWANMALHMVADPQALIAAWHRALAVDGFLMFSCLGPDTLRELRAVYQRAGWPPPSHQYTDMHDWGDMLVHAGFAEPVMDMERITLTWESPAKLLAELRGLGANLHPGRFPALRGRGWRTQLEEALTAGLAGADGRLALTFEVIYGHAVKPEPRVRVAEEANVSLQDMRSLLRGGRPPVS